MSLKFVVLLNLFIYFVSSITNPDGSCTNPIIWKFNTMEEYNDFIAQDTSDDINIVALRYNISTNNNALCLDGTNGVFYFRSGYGNGQTKYQIYMEGGGSCQTIDSCIWRSNNYLGSRVIHIFSGERKR